MFTLVQKLIHFVATQLGHNNQIRENFGNLEYHEMCRTKTQNVASVHFVAELGGNSEVGEARVVSSLSHPRLVVLMRKELSSKVLERKKSIFREKLTSKNLWLADLISASVLSKSIVTYPFAFVPAHNFDNFHFHMCSAQCK